jgi:hypothetical protein
VRLFRDRHKHRGAQTELIACAHLLGEGFEVFRNISAFGSADLVAWKGDEVLPIDVKSSKNGGLTEDQIREGVILLRINENGHCELDPDRERRIATKQKAELELEQARQIIDQERKWRIAAEQRDEERRALLAKVAALSPKEAAALLNQLGDTTWHGKRWTADAIITLRTLSALHTPASKDCE